MKVSFELPITLVHQLRCYIRTGHRSRFVADLISKNLRGKAKRLEAAAHRANKLRKLNSEMKAWEALNENDLPAGALRSRTRVGPR